jgi:hypothetical protein
MAAAKWTINTRGQQDLPYPGGRFNEKRCLPVWGLSTQRKFQNVVFVFQMASTHKKFPVTISVILQKCKVKVLGKSAVYFCKETMSQGQ